MHEASSSPINNLTDENDIIKPAPEGSLNVLNTTFNQKIVQRVVAINSDLAITGYCWNEI